MEGVNCMNQYRENNKDVNSNEKSTVKVRNGNMNYYFYKDPSGRTIQVVKPAFVKIKELT